MTTRVLAALLLIVVPAACTAVSTYPPTSGSAISKPNVSPGPEVMAKAIKEAHRITGLSGPVVFNLPAGLEQSTWSRVQTLIGENATPMPRDIAAGDEQVFSVQQLRLSGGVADVDVVYPERGVYQLMTVKLKGGPMLSWRVESAYRWVIPATAPIANAPVTQVETKQAEVQTEVVGAPATSPTPEVAPE
jgi:hypothetical protein